MMGWAWGAMGTERSGTGGVSGMNSGGMRRARDWRWTGQDGIEVVERPSRLVPVGCLASHSLARD